MQQSFKSPTVHTVTTHDLGPPRHPYELLSYEENITRYATGNLYYIMTISLYTLNMKLEQYAK